MYLRKPIFVLMIALLSFGPFSAQAATDPAIDVTVTSLGSACLDTQFQIAFSWISAVDDGSGSDLVAMIAYDGDGVPISSDWSGSSPPSALTRNTPFGNGDGINDLTARPITIEMYDVSTAPPGGANFQAQYDNILAQNAPLMLSATYDPASDVSACDSLPLVDSDGTARFRVTKTFTDNITDEVEVTLTCNGGLPLEQSFTIAGGDPAGVTFVVTNVDAGVSCEVTESGGPAGYTPVLNGGAGCSWDDVTGGTQACIIENLPDPATFIVNKEWIVPENGGGDEVVQEADITIECDAMIVGGEFVPDGDVVISAAGKAVNEGIAPPAPSGYWMLSDTVIGDDDVTATVDTTNGPVMCEAYEDGEQSGVETTDDCGPREITAGETSECTITNTVFFEGIPTLGRYGLAIMALLMLSMGLVGFRRFA